MIKTTKQDLKLINKIIPFTTADNIPCSFIMNGEKIKGIPASFSPEITDEIIDSKTRKIIAEGTNANGLTIRVEYIQYCDYSATEWVMFLTNNGKDKTPVISDIKIFDNCFFAAEKPRLQYSNGDNISVDGYEFFYERIDKPISMMPRDGTPCNNAFPYMRMFLDDCCVNMAIGWGGVWTAEFTPVDGGFTVSAKQARANMTIFPGETMRTPRVNLVASDGDESRSVNMWRSFYFDHIIPLDYGKRLSPKLCLHVWNPDGSEFTKTNEKEQLDGICRYIEKGVKPDIWWMDAGWYKCDGNWGYLGTWAPDKDRYPKDMTPLGEKCEENDIEFLVWFEPERVFPGTEIATQHSEWLLFRKNENPEKDYALFNLGNKEATDWLIEKVCGIIEKNHIHIYRQDFNYDPLPNWVDNETDDRIGALENLHFQGYLRYWDALRNRFPGLWIDSCASGGRRNELETMKRAVPLHYTDVQYSVHPIKQKQHRLMFEWLPYFRAHNFNDHDGIVPDKYSYHCALTPSMTDMLHYTSDDKQFALAREMTAIWRDAAALMLEGNYYPLSICRKSAEDYYAMQFDNGDKGFFQVVRNAECKEALFTAKLHLEKNHAYVFANAETGDIVEMSAEELEKGFAVQIPIRSGVIWFYQKI